MPEQAARVPLSTANNSVEDGTNLDVEDTEVVNEAYWYDNGQSSKTLTVDITNLKNGYILGDDVNIYLSNVDNYNANYCIYVDFTSTANNTIKQLRARLIPSITTNQATGKVSRYFRATINSPSGNDNCNLPSNTDGLSGTPSWASLQLNIANSVNAICTSCLNIITSEKLKVYKTNTQGTASTIDDYNEVLDTSSFSYQKLIFRVDMNSNSNNNNPTCTNASCNAIGFNCCVDGQCVNDGQQKLTRAQIMSTYPSMLEEFDLAELLKQSNAQIYLSYPQFYYICLENVPNDGDDGALDPTDPVADATKRLNEMIIDYYCIEELKANSQVTPFHTDPIDGSQTYSICKLAQDPAEDPSMYFRDVMKRMYKHCGCEADTYSDMVSNCPKYSYKSIYSNEDTGFDLEAIKSWITLNLTAGQDLSSVNDLSSVTGFSRIECVAPEVDPNILPFQDLEVIVSSKSAPHRLFDNAVDTNGNSIEVTDFSKIPSGASGTQEGEPFQYLDNEKLFPLNGEFNMNSILGQMDFGLTQARPAKLVNLEFDKLYYIATLEGYYTPCPTCAKDYWFPNFSPNPASSQGVGLQSVGYTTRRDAWGSNTTFGNYEDTIFGRACWLPPTMLPFSHDTYSTEKTQRLNRLKTQAAYYANGYQRDWYGFNKGALIGSFDGVTWFAVGKGRVIRATTNKLYLAINAPFADLAMANEHIVSVQEWDFITTGAQYDYNPEVAINSPVQNEAGLCQKNHQCETDSDCITQLGWEYTCADVNSYQTSWPKFDPITGREIANDEKKGSLIEMLAQGELPPGATSKRCVYRGAGAPCRNDYSQISDLEQRKALTCAPNFYCAPLTDTTAFNKEIARYGRSLEDISEPNNHYFGQEANILGRPKQYLSTGTKPLFSLPGSVGTSIEKNILLSDSTATNDIGICRPGKRLPSQTGSNWDPIEQHKAKDTSYRTDYISQISGCNTTLFTTMKMSSCPALDSDGNYMHLKDEYIDNLYPHKVNGTTVNFTRYGITELLTNSQNSCGLESLDPTVVLSSGTTADSLAQYSAFKSIEGKTLNSSGLNLEPTLTRDACFRKAGSVCHTDLDCSPNYKHADIIDIINPAFFGNAAEKDYWKEYLVCGQGPREPLIAGTQEFNEYDITNNRCCREIGNDITMYTEDSKAEPTSAGLNSSKFGSYYPNDTSRYSRYSIIEKALDSLNNTGTFRRPTAYSEVVGDNVANTGNNILSTNQWQTINEAGAKTCCGGGWVRKFADGTNDWSINRLNIDVNNFKCLSFRTPLVNTSNPLAFGLTSSQHNQDSQNLCLTANGNSAGCAQYTFEALTSFQEKKPILNLVDSSMILYSDPVDMKDLWASNLWSFMPLFSSDSNTNTWLDWSIKKEDAQRRNITVKIPAFITWADRSKEIDDPASSLKIYLENPYNGNGNTFDQCTRLIPSSYACGGTGWNGVCAPTDPLLFSTWSTTATTNACYYMYDKNTRILKVAHKFSTIEDANAYETYDLGVKLEFIAPGTLAWEKKYISQAVENTTSTLTFDGITTNIIEHRRSSEPGNALYYLNRLSKLELLGIPQITYEPLYCNDNYQKLVPGLFKESVDGYKLTNVVEFNNHPKTFLNETTAVSKKPWKADGLSAADSNWDADSINQSFVSTQELINHEPIFSDHDFKCCAPLGTKLQSGENMNKCCTGYAVEDEDSGSSATGTSTCMLPPGTNLNVYFNKFVSSEGTNSSLENPLTNDDFEADTGAPKFNSDVISKLQVLAQAFCAPNFEYTRGGAFGPFVAQPRGSLGIDGTDDENSVISIIDSTLDSGLNNGIQAGYVPFSNGFKWNNNIYCAGQLTQ